MNLFHCPHARKETIAAPTRFQTPLGSVRLEAILDGENAADETAAETYALPAGGWIACWRNENFDLKLLACRPAFTPQDGFSITDCWAGLWRLKARRPIASCVFTAAWEAGCTWRDGAADTGEGLYAKTWESLQTIISIGTEDEDFLECRARRGAGLPAEWASYFDTAFNDWQINAFWNNSVHDELGNNGLAVVLPKLDSEQICQIQFVLAWAANREPVASTWYAVERNAAEILAGGGCEAAGG